jgi:uncharacterized UBP type Zn finger protein
MTQQIQPTQIGNNTANQLLVKIYTPSMTETQCEVYCYLVDTTQTTSYVSKDNISETLPYKFLKMDKHIFTENNLDLVKQDENNALIIAANLLNVTLI